MELNYTKRFQKAAKALDEDGRELVAKALKLFLSNPKHPGLNFEKVQGTEYATIRVTRGCRIFMRQRARDAFDLIDVGPHDLYRRYG